MLGFTGTFEGAPISVQSTGMGCPSAGIVLRGADPARRHAAASASARAAAIGDGMRDGRHRRSACRRRPTTTDPLRYADMAGYAPTATFALAETAARLGREAGATVHVGPIVTSGIFYDPDHDNVAAVEARSATSASRWRRRCSTRSPPCTASRRWR